jgi:hypothetical protein
METQSKNQNHVRLVEGAEKDVPNDGGQNQQDTNREASGTSKEAIGNPVNNGGVAVSKADLHLEKQWLAVRDAYLSHYPEVQDVNSEYHKGGFSDLIENIAKRRQRTSKEIRDEIMEWSSTK